MKQRAIFLDRDGVLNQAVVRDGKPFPPATLDELNILPKVQEALELLKQKGYLLIVVTNQPDVARGKTSIHDVESINNFLMKNLPLDEIRTCYHDNDDYCSCRKPLPGLMLDAAAEYDIDLSESIMVGDRWRDIDAGIAAGCQTIWIDYGYNEKHPIVYDVKVQSLYDASKLIETWRKK